MSQTNAQKKAAAKSRRKQKERSKRASEVTPLKTMNAELQTALMNIRQMYDQATMEKTQLQNQLTQANQFLTAASIDEPLVITKDALTAVFSGLYLGYNVEMDESEEFYTLIAELIPEEVDEDAESIRVADGSQEDE